MPKGIWEIKDFSGGLNAYADPRDIEENQFAQNWNVVVDRTGILRIIGCAVKEIDASDIINTNFQKGYGLFQFSSDYNFSFAFEYGFDQGIHRGTVSAVTGGSETTTFTLDTTAPGYESSNNYYNNMTIFFYSATNNQGQSRNISSYGSGLVAVSPAFTGNVTTSDKYVIVRWQTENFSSSATDSDSKDWLTDNFSTNHYSSDFTPSGLNHGEETSSNSFYAVSQVTASDHETNDFDGYIGYNGTSGSNLSLKAGKQYTLSFYAAFAKSWQNFVSDGEPTGILDTAIDADGTVAGGTTSAINVDGTLGADLAAMQAKILNRLVYKSNGAFVGRCTAVAYTSSSDGTITFGAGTYTAIENNADLYVAGEGEKVPWVELYSTAVTNGYSTGLYLQANNVWQEGSNQTNYLKIPDVNYVKNGDFEDGSNGDYPPQSWGETYSSLGGSETPVTGGWVETVVGGSWFYGENGRSCRFSPGQSINQTGYLYQELTLYTGTLYHLNFVYRGKALSYSVYQGDTPIIPWTSSGTASTYDEGVLQPFIKSRWKYPFQQLNNSTNSYETKYIPFYVSDDKDNATATIQIRFRNTESTYIGYSGYVSIDGVSVTKAHNDLVTMSYNSEANSPLATTSHPMGSDINGDPNLGSLSQFSKYSMTFKIPEGYNDTSDWVLRLHSGKWGFQNGASNICNDGVSTATQEVYFDSIQITGESDFENKEVITLLQSNSASTSTSGTSTDIAINSSGIVGSAGGGKSWLTSFIKFNGSAIPIFNYNKGVVRISDANFSNSNDNVMLYYDNYKNSHSPKWKTRENYLQEPPEFLAKAVSDTIIDTSVTYDAIPHINELCFELTYTAPDSIDDETGSTQSGLLGVPFDTGWRYDQFGAPDAANVSIGILTRHICDWGYSVADHISAHTGGDSYVPSFDTRNNNISEMKHASSAGYSSVNELSTGAENEVWGDPENFIVAAQTSHAGGQVDDWYSLALTPLVIPIRLSNNELAAPTARSFLNGVDKQNTHVQDISFNITFHIRTYNNAHLWGSDEIQTTSEWTCDDVPIKERVVPTFEIWAIIPSGENALMDNAKAQNLINKASLENSNGAFSGDDIVFPILEDGTANPKIWGEEAQIAGVTIQQVINNQHDYDGITISLDDNFNDNPRLADLKFTIDKTMSLSRVDENGDIYNPVIGDGTTENPGQSILLFVKEHFTAPSRHDSIGGCLDNLIFKSGAHQQEGEGTPTEEDFEGTQYLTFFDSSLSGMESLMSNQWEKYSFWTKYFVNRCDLIFRNLSADELLEQEVYELTGKQLAIEMHFDDSPSVESSGWAGRVFKFAASSVNIFGEESALNVIDAEIGTFNIGECPTVTLHITNALLNDDFIKTTKIYMKSDDTDVWYLQFYLDHEDSNGTFYSTVSGSKDEQGVINSIRPNQTEFRLLRENVKDFNEVNSYESETFVSEKDGENPENLKCSYKTSVVANNRLYVGNIKQAGKVYSDRMIKSVDTKYGILPASNFIDVAINDGDEITALAFFKDKLLQFKLNKVFVINTSGDYEFLEDTFYNVGVHGQFSVINTKYGICWANADGFYLYDGSKLHNLIENKIPTSDAYVAGQASNRWCADETTPTGDCVVGYSTKRDIALVRFTRSHTNEAAKPSGAVYHFPTRTWTLSYSSWNDDSASKATGNMSNMITSTDGDILFYHISSVADDVTDKVNTIRKWEHDAVSGVHSTKIVYFTTKDITFGNINVRKKLYRVYITYKVKTDGTDSGMIVLGAVNGSGVFSVAFSQTSKFAFGESNSSGTTCYAGGTLDETDGKWKTAELKFNTPSEVNNITSFQLQFVGLAPFDFEINDISISYRTKNVK